MENVCVSVENYLYRFPDKFFRQNQRSSTGISLERVQCKRAAWIRDTATLRENLVKIEDCSKALKNANVPKSIKFSNLFRKITTTKFT